MTLIAAVVLPTNEFAFVADSIATVENEAAFRVGTTTHGEAIQSVVVRDKLTGYVEGACKIGAFGNTLCAAAGHSALIYEILKILNNKLHTWQSIYDVDDAMQVLQQRVFGNSLLNTNATLNFAFRTAAGILFCSISFSVLQNQNLSIQKQCKPIQAGEWWVGYFGSGSDLMGKYYPSSVGAYQTDLTLRNLIPSMLAMDLSAKVRTEQMNQASGVGGAFVSILLGQNDILRSTDVFHIHADSRQEIQFFCKMLYRRGLYLVNDVIGRKGYAMRSLEAEVAFQLNKYLDTEDITPEVNELLKFQSKAILLDIRSIGAPSVPNIRIIESKTDAAITGLEHLPLGAYPEPGSHLSLKCGSESYDLTVRPNEGA